MSFTLLPFSTMRRPFGFSFGTNYAVKTEHPL
jgi:hypothetical protein